MKFKLLLILLTFFGVTFSSVGKLNAQQDTIKGLIFTESFMASGFSGFWEITNLTNETIDLGNIEIGMMTPWGPKGETWDPEDRWMMLPEYDLAPGKSYVIALCFDATPEAFKLNMKKYWAERITGDSIWSIADLQIHIPEIDEVTQTTYGIKDSVSSEGLFLQGIWSGGSCVYLRQHRAFEGDSIVIDQVGGVFDNDGKNFAEPYDVAGVTDATGNSVLIRKYNVKQGNLNFAEARGVGEDDSEWIVVHLAPQGFFRDVYWTLGNHGNYVLDANTLESDVAEINFAAKTITVPWGTRRCDDVMHLMKYKPGLAWNYIMSPNYEDSLSCAAHTGDKIEIIACGDDAQKATFDIIVDAPDADNNLVVPAISPDPKGNWRNVFDYGILDWPRVTVNESGQDTIWGVRGGIPYDTRVDSLLKCLDKPANASWEMVWVDGVQKRANVKNGDLLKVTSESGKVKNYFIKVLDPIPSHVNTLSAITWPDIPEDYRGIFGWKGDTIPEFSAEVYSYRVTIPYDVDGIPALVCRTVDPNAQVTVRRAQFIYGESDERTTYFDVTAEDDTSKVTYSVEFIKETNPAIDAQPYFGEPFISEYIEYQMWGNSFMEIDNPGNQPLDLSDYMIAVDWKGLNPADVISKKNDGDKGWIAHRYEKYIPGYKWSPDSNDFKANPYIAERDYSVNSIVEPGEAFVMGGFDYIGEISNADNAAFFKEHVVDPCDVIFSDAKCDYLEVKNTWGEPMVGGSNVAQMWFEGNFFVFKILNDSIKRGLKPATDPNDFELLDEFGMIDGSRRIIAGVATNYNLSFRRKPEIHNGNPVYQASFGTNADDSEWYIVDTKPFSGYGYPNNMAMLCSDMGKHIINPVTDFLSIIQSNYYKVSEGHTDHETIDGVVTGTTVTQFLANIHKMHEGQTLTLLAASDGSELTDNDVLSDGDFLVVVSADGINTTKYILSVTNNGLSHDAVLTSTVYGIGVSGGTGMISGVTYSEKIADVIDNVTVPVGAKLQVIDGDGAYVSLVALNYDTVYVDATVTDDVYFEVTAEDNKTTITYQLVPDVSEDDAFIISYVYEIDQDGLLISYCPRGTNVRSLLGNIIAVKGASVKVVDKFGLERTKGEIADDDMVVVTSASGNVTRVYHIAILADKYRPDGANLAYILSDVYEIDQMVYNVSNVPDGESVTDFLSNITTAPGAAVVIKDSEGNIKTSGALEKSDIVEVTSLSGNNKVIYTIGAATGIGDMQSYDITLYPNPTSGVLHVSGVEPGNRIRVFNINGTLVSDVMVNGTLSTVSLEGVPTGIYLIQVTNGKELIGHFKVLKK